MKKAQKKNRLESAGVLVLAAVLTCLTLYGATRVENSRDAAASTVSSESVIEVKTATEPVEAEVEPEKIDLTDAPKVGYSEEELYAMAAAIYNEAGGDNCSDDTRRLVGYVILNRVNDPRFPDTIDDVLTQRSQYGRFHWTGIKFADRANLPQEQNAVQRAYRIAKEVLTASTIPIPKTVVFQAEFEQGVGLYSYQDGMYFCHAKEVK